MHEINFGLAGEHACVRHEDISILLSLLTARRWAERGSCSFDVEIMIIIISCHAPREVKIKRRSQLYRPANDPGPQMIPVPQMISKLDRKWSQDRKWSSDCTTNDPRNGSSIFTENVENEWTHEFGQRIYFIRFFLKITNGQIKCNNSIGSQVRWTVCEQFKSVNFATVKMIYRLQRYELQCNTEDNRRPLMKLAHI